MVIVEVLVINFRRVLFVLVFVSGVGNGVICTWSVVDFGDFGFKYRLWLVVVNGFKFFYLEYRFQYVFYVGDFEYMWYLVVVSVEEWVLVSWGVVGLFLVFLGEFRVQFEGLEEDLLRQESLIFIVE